MLLSMLSGVGQPPHRRAVGEGQVTSPGCAAASAPSARSGLPGFCTRSSPGGGAGASCGSRRFSFFFSICVVCLKILQHSFAAVCLRLKPMPLMRSHGGLDADRRCQNTSDPNARRPRAEFKRIKNRKRQRVATTLSMFV